MPRMNGFTIAADIGQTAAGIATFGAFVLWVGEKFRNMFKRRAARKSRTWHGYLNPHGVSSWHVEVIDQPDQPPGHVTICVTDEPRGNRADSLIKQIEKDGQLGRVPTAEQYDLIRTLYQKRFGTGFQI
jgi:hypothetical protein